jgi:hypothetical protein
MYNKEGEKKKKREIEREQERERERESRLRRNIDLLFVLLYESLNTFGYGHLQTYSSGILGEI